MSPAGRGRARGAPPTPSADLQGSLPKQPIFFRRSDIDLPADKTQFADPEESGTLPRSIAPMLSGSGRGKPPRGGESDPRPSEENRHLQNGKQPIGRRPPMARSQEATRRAVEILSRGGRSGPGGRGRGIVGRGRGRGRTTGERFGGGRGRGTADEDGLFLGDNADGEKLEKRLGEEKMKILAEAFEEMSSRVLPSPMEDAYLDALHTNNLIEYEPEYMVEFDNPDIDEKPPMSLEEVLAKARPFLMAYEGMKSHEEWEDAVKDLMERLPYMKELIEMYAGPKRVTAKEQQQELERVAKTIPENVPASVKRFTDRAVMSLKNNPGWGFDKKCQFMDKLVWEVSQHYK
ncbi:hypothetical protein HPP92_002279 [Vanilla planifolia]|uniref:Uncharacterized protein n=1 Tax=Vanilla planifolia TaxID=51239 RepID=A0A835VHS6_VANPL|nr:hypothetical protein HPP92_002279 [Vanilla planifolia]